MDFGQVNGRRLQRQFSTRAAAEAALSVARAEKLQSGVSAIAELSGADRAAFAAARDRLASVGATIGEAVEHFTATMPRERAGLDRAAAAFLAAKEASGRRPEYVAGLRRYMAAFVAGRGGVAVASIGPAAIDQWFRSRGEAARTARGNLGRLSSFFGFCHRRGWVALNPVAMVERVRVDDRPPLILSPGAAQRVLEGVRLHDPRLLGYVALGLFAGVRPAECGRLPWAPVELDRRLLTIDAAASKVRRRRIVDLCPAAVAWLRIAKAVPARRGGSWVAPRGAANIRRRLRVVRARLSPPVPWGHDILRHSAASYMMARDKDAGRVADQLGNSAAILLRHYRELVSAEAAAQYWEIKP
jgi:integrase/recombinase XerC